MCRVIKLSPNAQSIQWRVKRPIESRKPIGYKWEFLDTYQPNDTFYLSESERQHLHNMGKTGILDAPGTYALQIFNRLLIDLSWNSCRLEGNTYSLLETKKLLAISTTSAEKQKKEDAIMILNHKKAIKFFVESREYIGINSHTILHLHTLLSNNLLGNERSQGRLRSIEITIGKSTYTPLKFPQQIEECFRLILSKAHSIQDPFEQAFFLMVHLPYLQPFEDVNKRVSRLSANIPLLLHNLKPLSFIDVPQNEYITGILGVYELNRIDLLKDIFLFAYERSCSTYSSLHKQLC